MTTTDDLRHRFAALHDSGTFVMPNPWDVGSARILEGLGFPALATTSSGLAASLGRMDQQVTLPELVEHVSALSASVEVPLSVDAEYCFADTADGIGATVERIAAAGAAGISIEDYHPAHGLYSSHAAAERVAAAAEAAHRQGLILTARAENHLYGVADLDDTITRLVTYGQAGADVLYAPGLEEAAQLRRLIEAVPGPVNVLLRRHGPTVDELTGMGRGASPPVARWPSPPTGHWPGRRATSSNPAALPMWTMYSTSATARSSSPSWAPVRSQPELLCTAAARAGARSPFSPTSTVSRPSHRDIPPSSSAR